MDSVIQVMAEVRSLQVLELHGELDPVARAGLEGAWRGAKGSDAHSLASDGAAVLRFTTLQG